jgi:hypothetical protein
MKTSVLLLIGFSGVAPVAIAQQRQANESALTTTVSGRVFCADTNAPARMATVILQPADAVDAYDPDKQGGVSSRAEAVQTLLDGSFLISHVAPGAYYVLASAPGYFSPLASVLRHLGEQKPSGDAISMRIAKVVPRLMVQANLPNTLNVTLERGAAVSGTVQFDDGSPAAGVDVRLLVRGKEGLIDPPLSPFENEYHGSKTDDQGAYRISGLPSGDYVVTAQLNPVKMTYTLNGIRRVGHVQQWEGHCPFGLQWEHDASQGSQAFRAQAGRRTAWRRPANTGQQVTYGPRQHDCQP